MTLIYDSPSVTYDSPNWLYDGAPGPLWIFTPPSDTTRPFEDRPIFSIWTRVSFKAGSAVIKRADGTWVQEDVTYSSTEGSPGNALYFGPHGFSGGLLGTVDSASMGYDTPLRLYRGGHVFVIDDILRGELLTASTPQHPGGYGAFIVPAPAPAVFTGDDIIAGGYAAEFPAVRV